MNDTQNRLRRTVKDLFSEGTIDLFIGYENGSLPYRSRPCFLRDQKETEKLVWNRFCSNNLSVYLPGYFQKKKQPPKEPEPLPNIGIAAKGCDARSIVGLLKENQIPREHVFIVGVPCGGVLDPAKIEYASGRDNRKAPGGDFDGLIDMLGGSEEDYMLDSCVECTHPTPSVVDLLIEGQSKHPAEQGFQTVEAFEERKADDRRSYIAAEMSRCIRCYACRQACPNCYCKICFADQTKPKWIGAGDDPSDTFVYHLIRAFHQAGRCVSCDACVRACPVGLDLRILNQKLEKDVEQLFGYVPGLSAEESPPLCTFAEDDSQSFMTEP